MNGAFPPLSDQHSQTEPFLIGPTARHTYSAKSIFNLSGMSFGALSHYDLKGCSDIVFQIGTAKYGVRDAEGMGIIQEVETIAHSVGVSQPRQMGRHHVRLVQQNGRSVQMNHIYPAFPPLD